MGGCNNTKHDTTAETKNTQTEEQVESDGDASDEEASKDIFAMDTYMTVTAYGDQAQEAVDEAGAEIERLDNLLSTGNEESEIAKLNQSGSATLSEDAGYPVPSVPAGNWHLTDSVSPSWIPMDLCIQLSDANFVPYVATAVVRLLSEP